MQTVKIVKNIFITALYLLIAYSNALADEALDLERIVVTGSYLSHSYADSARSVDVVSRERIEESAAYNLSDILKDKASVDISDYGFLGASKNIRLRGLEGKQVLVLVDGRPVNNSRDGSFDLGTINLDNVERIEVLRGAGANLYGSSAMGGVVNIITKDMPRGKPSTTVSSKFGTGRTYEENISHAYKKERIGYLINYDFQKSEGFRDNSEFQADDVDIRLDYDFNPDNNLSLKSGYYESEAGLPGSITSPDLDDKQTLIKKFIDLDYRRVINESNKIKLKAYENYERLEFIESLNPLDQNTHTTVAYGLDAQYICELTNDYSFVFGLNRMDNSINSSTSGKHSYFINAFYIENEIGLFTPLDLNLSLRVDDYSTFGREVNPSLNLRYELNPNAGIYFFIARTFRSPSFNDLYWPADGGYEGNPNLSPETGISAELGFNTRINENLNLSLAVYRSDFDDLIAWAQGSDDVYRPSNINSAVIDGVEFDCDFSPTENLKLDISYAYVHAKDDKTEKFLTYRPEHKSDVSIAYNFAHDLSVALRGQFVNRAFANTSNTQFVKRYYLFGLDINKELSKQLSCFLSFGNLTNRKYQKVRNYPMPGFTVNGGFRLEF